MSRSIAYVYFGFPPFSQEEIRGVLQASGKTFGNRFGDRMCDDLDAWEEENSSAIYRPLLEYRDDIVIFIPDCYYSSAEDYYPLRATPLDLDDVELIDEKIKAYVTCIRQKFGNELTDIKTRPLDWYLYSTSVPE